MTENTLVIFLTKLTNFRWNACKNNRVKIQRSLYAHEQKYCFSEEKGTYKEFKSYCSQGYMCFLIFSKWKTEDSDP